ncbi:hypothetical protein ACFQO7_24905 [Catellatospora aurea]|uniref:Pyrroloquinoline-quinone binding quinoprotein n=1 Tax=Catellatospora aurea TaxID=1337874 RepID=A0ABW2H0T7_9ACTN
MTGSESSGAAVIDLGEGWAADPAERPSERRRWTVPAAALCLALLALTVTADRPRPPARLTELARWAEPQAFLLATAGTDTLLVQTHDAITAYDAADGRPRWSLPRVVDSIHDAGGLLVLGMSTPEGESSTEPQYASNEAVAVDRITGQVRWRAQAYLQPVGGLLLAYSGDPQRPAVEVRDPATYALRWRVPARPFAVDAWGSGLWELAGDGQLVEHDLATGAVRRRARVELPDGTRRAVLTSRDAVGVFGYRVDADGFEQVAGVRWYARDGLAAVNAEHRWIGEYDCGAGTSCAYPADGATPFLIDSATGTPIRSLPDTAHVGSDAGLLVFADGRVGSDVSGRLEPGSGRLRTDVAGWRVLSTTGQVARILGHEDHDPFATHVAELTADGLRPLGREPHGLVQCATVPRAAVCTTTSGEVVIWRIGEELP